tara:strand:+ start:445 stop:897 length:453 start_codon:yes stop_codon:yes gene_type:complete
MKKFFTILCAAMLSFGVSAQTDAGNMYLGATSNLTLDFGDTENMNFDALAGYFMMDNLAVMAILKYSKAGDADGEFGFGAGVRYYMNNIYGQFKYEIPGEDQSEMAIGLGYAAYLNDNVSVEPSFNYIMGDNNGADNNYMTLKVGFALHM